MSNLILKADAYTISSNAFVSKLAKEKSVYNLTNRYNPRDALPELCRDSRMVMFGLSYFINKHLTKQITHEDVSEAKYFMSQAHSFGGPMAFDEVLWRRVVDEYNGYLPIKIKGVREGSTFFPNQPYVQVESDVGFGEIAAHIEAMLVGYVSIGTARATINRHWYDRFKEYIVDDGVEINNIHNYAKWMVHDFGMRASSCEEESEFLGLTHLLTFKGTDTFNAASLAKRLGAKEGTGTSIHALAHRIVQGHPSESEAFTAIQDKTEENCKVNIASYVSDCYHFDNALKVLAQLAKDNPNNIYVCRPDSGDYIKNVLDICEYSLTNLRFIQGDSMNPVKVFNVVKAMKEKGFALHEKGIFGVGGWLRNTATRDLFSSAYKLSAIGVWHDPVCKLSEVRGKMSVPGPNSIAQITKGCKNRSSVYFEGGVSEDALVPYYNHINNYTDTKQQIRKNIQPTVRNESFNFIEDRNMESFENLSEFANSFPDYGMYDTVFSDQIVNFRDSIYKKYRS